MFWTGCVLKNSSKYLSTEDSWVYTGMTSGHLSTEMK